MLVHHGYTNTNIGPWWIKSQLNIFLTTKHSKSVTECTNPSLIISFCMKSYSLLFFIIIKTENPASPKSVRNGSTMIICNNFPDFSDQKLEGNIIHKLHIINYFFPAACLKIFMTWWLKVSYISNLNKCILYCYREISIGMCSCWYFCFSKYELIFAAS